MATNLIPKYHAAPNFSINPPECGGTLELGSIITSLATADEPPVNMSCRIRIPVSDQFCSHQNGFTATREKMRSGELGVTAKLLGLAGVGGEISASRKVSNKDVWQIQRLDTLYFSPNQQYLTESMAKPDVKEYIQGSGYQPVYMITGLKVAHKAAVNVAHVSERGGLLQVGVDGAAIGVPVGAGPKVGSLAQNNSAMAFENSTDFVVGIRVRKLVYKRHWLLLTRGELTSKEHSKGATLVDDDQHVETPDDEILELDDDLDDVFQVDLDEQPGEALEAL